MTQKIGFLIVNFGGPRDLDEIRSFLTELLTDRDVVRSNFPSFFHRWFFTRIARKRALKIRVDYELIGGRSPIYFDTEATVAKLSDKLDGPILALHRYLPATHESTIRAIEAMGVEEIRVIPMFPQFSYATTGSIARFLSERLTPKTVQKLHWVQSYAGHSAFVGAYQTKIAGYLQEKQIDESELVLLFSSHGVPRSFIASGDFYQAECELSFNLVRQAFPKALCRLSYQSKFGRGEWIRPYTDETCSFFASWSEGRKKVVVVPLSFTSDHIETLFEIEELYLPLLREQGAEAYRCPALNLEPYWIDAVAEISKEPVLRPTSALIRNQ